MPRTCTICRHAERAAIDSALVERRPFRDIAGQHDVSKSALVRHFDDHLPAKLAMAKVAAEVVNANSLLDQVTSLRSRAITILDTAEKSGDLKTAISAIREARSCVELLGKLAGELQDAPTINVVITPEWRRLQAVILAALEPHTEARLAVASALTDVEHVHAAGHA